MSPPALISSITYLLLRHFPSQDRVPLLTRFSVKARFHLVHVRWTLPKKVGRI